MQKILNVAILALLYKKETCLVRRNIKSKMQQECIPVGCVPALVDRMLESASWGVCLVLWGVYLVRGGLPGLGGSAWSVGGSGIPACTEADTLPPVDRQTPVKTLPWPQLRCGR